MPNSTNNISTCLSKTAISISQKIFFMMCAAGLNDYMLCMVGQVFEIKRPNNALREAAISGSSVLLFGMILADLAPLPSFQDLDKARDREAAKRYNLILGGVYLLAWMALTIPANAGAAILIKDPEGWKKAGIIQTWAVMALASYIFLITTGFAIKSSIDSCCDGSISNSNRVRVFPGADYVENGNRQTHVIRVPPDIPEEIPNQNQENDRVYEFA